MKNCDGYQCDSCYGTGKDQKLAIDNGIDIDCQKCGGSGVTELAREVRNFLATALEEQRAEYVRIIDDSIRIEKMTHRVGSHSDDYGGESDYPCDCDEVERKHKISALESVKKRILTQKKEDNESR